MLEIKNLGVTKGEKKILRGIDLTIPSGEKVVILGESGSGKSTLLKSIILFEQLKYGTIKFRNRIINESNVNEYRKNFVYISQKAPQSFYSVKEYICLPFKFNHNRDLSPDQTIFEHYLDRMNFKFDILAQNYNDLSGGEQQRITIIQALLLNKPYYLLDEITSNLDKQNVSKVMDEILFQDSRSIVYVTHNTDHLDRFDKIYRLQDGLLTLEVS